MRRIMYIWRRLGTFFQAVVVCLLAAALVVSLTAIALAEVRESSEGSLPFALVPPAPTPAPTHFPEIVMPDWDENLSEPVDDRPISLLTGLHVDEEYFSRRPIAVVINNSFGAHPQSGITCADIVYEVLAEGNTTRIVAIFQSSIPEKIGPVRSARDYFVDFALNHDAFFVHHGGSPSGYQRIRSLLGANSIDGIRYEGTIFWRDRSFPGWTGNTGQRSVEHSSFTSWERLNGHIDSRDVRGFFNGDANERPNYGFVFGAWPLGQESMFSDVSRVVVPFARDIYTAFVLDDDTGLYYVEHARGPWMDAARTQASVRNILVQRTAIRVVDDEGRRNVTTVGSGTGFLVRDGLVFNVRWEKASHAAPMQWFFEDGSPIVLAPGRTWINVLQTSAAPEFVSRTGETHEI